MYSQCNSTQYPDTINIFLICLEEVSIFWVYSTCTQNFTNAIPLCLFSSLQFVKHSYFHLHNNLEGICADSRISTLQVSKLGLRGFLACPVSLRRRYEIFPHLVQGFLHQSTVHESDVQSGIINELENHFLLYQSALTTKTKYIPGGLHFRNLLF